MEIEDCAYPLVQSVLATTELKEAFQGVQVAILVGGFPRGPGMERKDLMAKNRPIFVAAGQALNDYAAPDCRVLVVANPANTNCAIAAKYAPKLPKSNFSALTRLDMNRGMGQVAKKLNANANQIKNVIIWGNHSKTQVPDASQAVFTDGSGSQTPLSKKLDESYFKSEFMTIVQNRGADVIAARGLSSAMSAANAVKDHLRSWLLGTAPGEFVSMAVYTGTSNAPYGVASDLFYSLPVTCKDGNWSVVTGLEIPPYVKEAMKVTEKELLEEKSEAGIA